MNINSLNEQEKQVELSENFCKLLSDLIHYLSQKKVETYSNYPKYDKMLHGHYFWWENCINMYIYNLPIRSNLKFSSDVLVDLNENLG